MREKIKSAARRVLAQLPPPDLRDVLCFGGLGCVFYGLQMVSPSLAWVVTGGALFWLSVRSTHGPA